MNTTTNRRAAITAVTTHFPEQVLTNEDITRMHPDWSVEKIYDKTGIRSRHIAAPDETALDLGEQAGKKMFDSGACTPEQIDLLVFCTQTPDYALPTTACLLQDRLQLPTTCAAFDCNLGCSGFVYGLSMVKGMLETRQASKALLVTAETYSKWIDPQDKSVRTIFGDGAAVSLVEMVESPDGGDYIGPFVFGTDGSGANRLIVHGSGARPLDDQARNAVPEGHAVDRLYMDGPGIFTFTIRTVPRTFSALLEKGRASLDDVDYVIFHQANKYILEYLRKRIKIPEEKFVYAIEQYGNTVSCTIPIAMKEMCDRGTLKKDMTIAIVGFGVGYSWGAGLLTWKGE